MEATRRREPMFTIRMTEDEARKLSEEIDATSPRIFSQMWWLSTVIQEEYASQTGGTL